METLAIIAYKQPITKSEIESIRGVNCDYAVQKLLEKDLVIISGRNEDAVGKPLIYATSKSFMDYFGINSADELPKINEVLMEELVKSTAVSDQAKEQEEEELDLPAGIIVSSIKLEDAESVDGVSVIEDLEINDLNSEQATDSDATEATEEDKKDD
jgi:segregation and condensation protein B